MKKKTLYMVSEDDGPEILVWDPEFYEHKRPAKPKEETLERLAQMLDEHAENINAHDFVTTHRALAAMLYRQVGRAQATAIFRRLTDFEGLHGLTGVRGRTDPAIHEKELGVPLNNWKDWTLTAKGSNGPNQ